MTQETRLLSEASKNEWLKVFEHIMEHEGVTTADIVEMSGLSVEFVTTVLADMLERNIVLQSGFTEFTLNRENEVAMATASACAQFTLYMMEYDVRKHGIQPEGMPARELQNAPRDTQMFAVKGVVSGNTIEVWANSPEHLRLLARGWTETCVEFAFNGKRITLVPP